MTVSSEERLPRVVSMSTRALICSVLVMLAYGCASTTPPTRAELQPERGVASWYGEEFAGRTTANGEIFDPTQLTAAHRTLPFGTIVDISNPRNGQSVRVRINDRGPYIGGRLIDLSYAAAQKIGLVEPGIGEVDLRIIKVGSGEREPPQPFNVTVAEAPRSVPPIAAKPATDAPPVEFPLPAATPKANPPAPAAPIEQAVVEETPAPVVEEPVVTEEPVVVDRVEVETQRDDTVTRRQVSADGKRIEEVPVEGAAPRTTTTRTPAPASTTSRPNTTTTRRTGPQFIVQVGAFSVEANAKALHQRITALGQRAYIDKTSLWRVRIGPFTTRDQAVTVRSALEAKGVSAIILTE